MLRHRGAPRPALPPGPYLVVGLRRAGVAAARALAAAAGADAVAGWDATRSDAVSESIAELRKLGVRASVGGDPRRLLDGPGAPACVVKSPGVPPAAPPLDGAAERGIEIVDEAEIGWRLDGRPLVGVTGTNGKSTVCALAAAVLDGQGAATVVAGNTAFGPPLSALAEHAADVVVAELSSFQLAGSPALLPDAAVFTNLSDDHWEHHGGRAAYAAAKRRMLVRGERAVAVAAVNVDDPEGAELGRLVAERGGRVVGYGRARDARVRIASVRSRRSGATVELTVDGRPAVLETRLPGDHNALNAAAAIALATGLDLDLERTLAAVASCPPVPGRLEPVDEGQPFAVLVDYAHNPAGVRAVFAAVRQMGVRGRLIVVSSALAVFDRRQHREHGAALAAADELIVSLERFSADEPRDAPPPGLLEGVAAAGGTATVIADRRAAVRAAVRIARPGDAVLILNRGVRRSPILDDRDRTHRPPDDRELAAAAIRERSAA